MHMINERARDIRMVSVDFLQVTAVRFFGHYFIVWIWFNRPLRTSLVTSNSAPIEKNFLLRTQRLVEVLFGRMYCIISCLMTFLVGSSPTVGTIFKSKEVGEERKGERAWRGETGGKRE